MPRQAHGRPVSTPGKSRPAKRKATGDRALSAFAIAREEVPSRVAIQRHRLGETERTAQDLGGRSNSDRRPEKRRRINEGESSSEEDDDPGSDGQEWHLGVNEDDDDSDIDSDEALGESDEERFEGFAFRGSTSQPARNKPSRKGNGVREPAELDLEEELPTEPLSEEGEGSSDEDDLGEDAVDLATALDMNEEDEPQQKQLQSRNSRRNGNPDEMSGLSDTDEAESEDEASVFSISSEEDLDHSHKRLASFVQDLENKESADASSKRQKGAKVSSKLTIADLLPTITDPRLRESLKMLHKEAEKGPTSSSKKGVPGKLEPPLPKRQQDRLDREAAYEKSKETLARWIDTVKNNRRADHISFPLVDPSSVTTLGTNQLMPTSLSEPITQFETALQRIMAESGITQDGAATAEDQVQAFEQLQEKKISLQEAQFRRAELRKTRELMFREEIRARRIKKIKSKAYRRVHRKERDRIEETNQAALVAGGAIDSEEERERQHRRRAEERMGQRHKESRWAKEMKHSGRNVWDDDARAGVTDMARRDEELRKRIEGKGATDPDALIDDTETSSDDASVDEYDEVEGLKLRKKLDTLESAPEHESAETRLLSMPFMRRAESARQAANNSEIRTMRRMVAGEEVEQEDEEPTEAINRGRGKFGAVAQSETGPGKQGEMTNEFEERLSGDEAEGGRALPDSQGTQRSKPPTASITKKLSRNNKADKFLPTPEVNPWLSGPKHHSRKSGASEMPSISSKATLSAAEGSKSRQDKKKGRPAKPRAPLPALEDLTSPSESDETPDVGDGSQQKVTRNQELVKMAFAGDDVFRGFADEKKTAMAGEGDQVVDNTLPGWGSWTGAGISKKERKQANSRKTTTIVKGIDPKSRKDAKLDRVIINEKRCKKNARYLAPELPHPFESRQQYERSLRLPLGPEWTTKMTFQDATKPRVLIKQGIIRPMEQPAI